MLMACSLSTAYASGGPCVVSTAHSAPVRAQLFGGAPEGDDGGMRFIATLGIEIAPALACLAVDAPWFGALYLPLLLVRRAVPIYSPAQSDSLAHPCRSWRGEKTPLPVARHLLRR